jgi:hypothetical protein
MLNDCPPELWARLDADAIAADLGAVAVKLNGPRHWMIDGLGQKVAVVDPIFRDFEGLTMRRIAVIDLGDSPASPPTPRPTSTGVRCSSSTPDPRCTS